MEFISKQDLFANLEKKYGDLTNECGCNVHTENGFKWLSVANVVDLVNECGTYDGNDDELDRAEKEIQSLKRELEHSTEAYEIRIALLQKALLKATTGKDSVNGLQVTKTDFLAIYNKALETMFKSEEDGTFDPDQNDIYGYDFTIHWHGIYCNCYDGAMPSNHIIPAIEGLNDEDPDEEYGA